MLPNNFPPPTQLAAILLANHGIGLGQTKVFSQWLNHSAPPPEAAEDPKQTTPCVLKLIRLSLAPRLQDVEQNDSQRRVSSKNVPAWMDQLRTFFVAAGVSGQELGYSCAPAYSRLLQEACCEE